MKVFQKLGQHETELSFKGWLRKIMINSAIDYYRKEVKHYNHVEATADRMLEPVAGNALDDISYTELIGMIQQLSPAYRTVFNLHVIDGFNHNEISKILNISEGTSKSNLKKARENLKEMIEKANRKGAYARYV